MNSIMKRRSIRRFKDTPITDQQLEKILRAGMAAPTSENDQEWVFIIVNDKDSRKRIMDKNEYTKALETAPLAIVVCAVMRKVGEPNHNFWVQDLSAVSQNMLLQATEMGLGSLWMGMHSFVDQIENLKEILDLPEYIEPMSLLAFGEAQRPKDPIDRYIKESVHYEKYREE